MARDDITDDTTPRQAHDIWERETDLQADELRALRGDPVHDAYLDDAEGRQTSDPPLKGGPLDDAITLAETPADEWTDAHKQEAEEALNWRNRHEPQFDPDAGEDLVDGDGVRTNKREVAAARWGFDFDDDSWP